MRLILSLLTLHLASGESNLSRGITDLTFKLSSNIESESDAVGDNFVWSPYSAHSAFSQVLLGARSSSLTQLQSVLGINKQDTVEYQQLRSQVEAGNSTLKISNLIALDDKFKTKPSFPSQLQRRFNSKLLSVDFAGRPKESVNQINEFVADATNDKIKELLQEDQIDPLTKMVLVNAVYFKALWQTAFDPQNTFNSRFNTSTGPVDTPFMTLNLKARIFTTVYYRMLELPYQDESKSLLIVLPEQEDANVMNLLRNSNFSEIRSEIERDVNVLLPKFKIKDNIQLKPLMQSAGAKDIFTEKADLTDISDQPLQVSDAVQEAFIEVNEEGTEAAAATGIILGLRIGIRRVQFTVDRPFAFVVYDFDQQVPLFVGKVNNPASSVAVRRSSTSSQPANSVSAGSTTSKPANVQEQDVCGKQRDNIPNALNNVELCKQATDGKLFDWLRRYRSVCEESNRVKKSFMDNNCGPGWCEYAKSNLPAWTNQRRGCAARQLDSCRTNENRLKAFSTLSCQRR